MPRLVVMQQMPLFRITKVKAIKTLEGEEYHLETLGDPKDPSSEACEK